MYQIFLLLFVPYVALSCLFLHAESGVSDIRSDLQYTVYTGLMYIMALNIIFTLFHFMLSFKTCYSIIFVEDMLLENIVEILHRLVVFFFFWAVF